VGPNWGTITTPVASTVKEPRAPIHAKMALTPKAWREYFNMKKILVLLSMLSLVFLSACASESANQSTSTPSVTESPSEVIDETINPISLTALSQKEFIGKDLKLEKVLGENSKFTRYFVKYKSGELTISGIMNVPKGEGPFPTLVLAHGYIDPAIYTTGRGLAREQKYLAERGYVVLHTDYRNHAESDDDPENDINFRLGYTEDVVNAALALKNSEFTFVDKERIGLLGRSMGGGIAFNSMVVKPGVFDAYVAFAPVSANVVDNYNRWTRMNFDIANEIDKRFGLPDENPEFWKGVSAINYFDKATEPLLILHGTADDTCDIAWSEAATKALQDAGKQVEFIQYEGEGHAFIPRWEDSMKETIRFFETHLKS
jgi:dienelactone hydrolase